MPAGLSGYWSLHAYNFWYEHLVTSGVHDRNAVAGPEGRCGSPWGRTRRRPVRKTASTRRAEGERPLSAGSSAMARRRGRRSPETARLMQASAGRAGTASPNEKLVTSLFLRPMMSPDVIVHELCRSARAAKSRILNSNRMKKLGTIGIWSIEMRFGDPGQVVEAACELESLGYSAIWFPGGIGGEVFQGAERLLSATQNLTIATGVLNIWKHAAAEIADWWHNLAPEFQRRMVLGLGVSHAAQIGAIWGKPVATMRNYLDQLAALACRVRRKHRSTMWTTDTGSRLIARYDHFVPVLAARSLSSSRGISSIGGLQRTT